MASIAAILAMLLSVLVSGSVLILFMAGMPNSSPEQLREIRGWMVSVVVVALIGLAGSIWGLTARRPWLSAGVGLAPAVYAIGLVMVLAALRR